MPLVEAHWLGSAGAVGPVSIAGGGRARDGGSLVVTAVADSGGKLKLIVWEFDGEHLLRRGDTGVLKPAIAVDRIASCGSPVDDGLVTTVVRDSGSHKPRLLFWSSAAGKGGAVRPVLAAEAHPASTHDVTQITVCRCSAGVVTAALRGDHRLSLEVWDYVEFSPDGHGLGPHRVGDYVSDIEGTMLAVAGWAEGIVTAVRDKSSGELHLRAWKIGADGSIAAKGAAAAGKIADVALTAVTDHRLVTVVKNDGGDLEAIVWDLNAHGGTITQKSSIVAPPPAAIGTGLDVCSLGEDVLIDMVIAPGQVAAVSREATLERMKVTIWDIGAQGTINVVGDLAFDPVDSVAMVFGAQATHHTTFGQKTPETQVLVAARRAGGNLGVFEFGVANDDVIPDIPAWASIDFTMQRQTESEWCWAATSTSVAHFYKPSSAWTQCKVANKIKGRSDCCGKGASGPCNEGDSLGDALQVVGHYVEEDGEPASFSDVQAQIAARLPFCARIAWSGGGAHFMAIVGYDATEGEYMTIADPIYGVSVYDYATYRDAYRHSGTWTTSYPTKP